MLAWQVSGVFLFYLWPNMFPGSSFILLNLLLNFYRRAQKWLQNVMEVKKSYRLVSTKYLRGNLVQFANFYKYQHRIVGEICLDGFENP